MSNNPRKSRKKPIPKGVIAYVKLCNENTILKKQIKVLKEIIEHMEEREYYNEKTKDEKD